MKDQNPPGWCSGVARSFKSQHLPSVLARLDIVLAVVSPMK
jgi:hypothetical protein